MTTRDNGAARTNFAHLEAHDEQLVRLGMLAERYFAEDPNTLYRGSPVINSGVKIFGAAAFTPSVIIDTNSFAPGNLAGFLDVLLLLQQWGTTAGALSVKVSMDLVLRA